MPGNCPITKTTCKDSAIVNSIKKLINQLESDNERIQEELHIKNN